MPKKDSRVKDIEKDLNKYADLETLALSAGGKILVDNLATDILGGLERLESTYKTATHIELITAIADIDNKHTILLALLRSRKNKEDARATLKEELLRIEEEERNT